MVATPLLIGSALLTAGTAAATMLSKPKVPKVAAAPTVNKAAEEAQRRDVLSRRRTPAADMLMGAGGAESATGAKSSLGA